MDLCALLLLCLSQAELGRPWTEDVWRESDQRTDGVPAAFPWKQKNVNLRETRSTGRGGVDIMLGENGTGFVNNTERYYSWKSFGPDDEQTQNLWIDFNNGNNSQARIHGILSNAHRQAVRVVLSFDFPFYGHHVRQIIVATGGFIFMGELSHQMLTATQYVAPLMANFDPSFSGDSTVGYWDNGYLFAVQWDKVRLKGREDEGAFTFQAVLHYNGSIIFNYRDVPVPVKNMDSSDHPAKVGMSDAFTSVLSSEGSRRSTIYEYHRVEIDTTKIVSGSSFVFTPLPTCVQLSSCELCLAANATLGCGWCNTLQRCSNGIDRHRQEWLDFNCPEEAKSMCEEYSTSEDSLSSFNQSSPSPTQTSAQPQNQSVTTDLQVPPPKDSGVSENTAIIAGVVAALVLLVILTLLVVYYVKTHPTAASPFYLMQRGSNNYWPSMKFHNQSYAEVELGGHEKDGFMEAEQCS